VFETCAANQRTGIGVADQRQEDINTCAKLAENKRPIESGKNWLCAAFGSDV